jgi:hypothetical protein
LPKEKADKCFFILHTELVSDAGTDLLAVAHYIFGKDYKNIAYLKILHILAGQDLKHSEIK